jgi:GMP synthase-like glutamine amidotransferase
LWIIDPSMATAETQGVAEIVGDWPGEHRLFQPALRRGDGPGPDTGYQTDGVVLMGSRASVDDGFAWLEVLRRWVEPIVSGQVRMPLLGICFGHQLIGHVAGAAVGFLGTDRVKRLGVEDSTLEGGTLIRGRQRIPVVVSHREELKHCPAGFRVVAHRPAVAVDGIEHEKLPIFAFQFHPEAREQFAGTAGIAPERIDDRVRAENRKLLAAFRRRVASER